MSAENGDRRQPPMVSDDDLTVAERTLGYQFSTAGREMLRSALVHYALQHGPSRNRARVLEQFGDALVAVAMCGAILVHVAPEELNGMLQKVRSILVSNLFLARLAVSSGLVQVIRVAGYQSAKPLADVMEALFGAIALDSDEQTAIDRIKALAMPHLQSPLVVFVRGWDRSWQPTDLPSNVVGRGRLALADAVQVRLGPAELELLYRTPGPRPLESGSRRRRREASVDRLGRICLALKLQRPICRIDQHGHRKVATVTINGAVAGVGEGSSPTRTQRKAFRAALNGLRVVLANGGGTQT